MTTSKYRLGMICVLLAASILSCTLGTPLEKPGDATGSLTLSFAGMAARDLLPAGDMTLHHLDLVLSKPGSVDVERTGLSAGNRTLDPIVLEIGTWTVMLNGYNAADELIATGTGTAVIVREAVTAVSVTVRPLSGNGTLSLTATIGSGTVLVPALSGTLHPAAVPGAGSEIPFDMTVAGDGLSATFYDTTVPAGWYTMTISLFDDGVEVIQSEPEAVRIAEGRITSGDIGFAFDPGLDRVVVSIALAMDDPITVTLGSESFPANRHMPFTAVTSEPVTKYRWFIDGSEVPNAISATLDVQGSIGVGRHRLGVIVSTASKSASTATYIQVGPAQYAVTYDGNGAASGEAPVDGNTAGYLFGAAVGVSGNTGSLVKTGYHFEGWNTSADGTGTDHAPGSTFAMGSGDVVLHAKWAYDIGAAGPAGGFVFYDKGSYSDGWRYLEAAPGDLASAYMWHSTYTATGATATGTGSGEANTARIVSVLGAGTYAAYACDSLVLGGCDDWFLPSNDELSLMRTNLYMSGIGGFTPDFYSRYWSSTEMSTNAQGASVLRFSDNWWDRIYKDGLQLVRPVRSF